MNRRWLLGAFAAVCVAQLAVPALMIRTYESTLARGREFKVRCAPIHPGAALQGRYVRVDLRLSLAPGDAVDETTPGERVGAEKLWAVLEEGPDGFARASSILRERPADGDVVPVRYAPEPADPVHPRPPGHEFRMEIYQYYVTESKIAEPHRVTLGEPAEGGVDAYATVRVLDGVAVIERLYLAGMPIEEYDALPPPK